MESTRKRPGQVPEGSVLNPNGKLEPVNTKIEEIFLRPIDPTKPLEQDIINSQQELENRPFP
jgi:hypothetical protein